MKKRLLCVLLAVALAAGCLAPTALAEGEDAVTVAPGYDYTRFQGAGVTLNVYNWGEYISNGADGSLDVVRAFENLTGIRVN